MKFQPTGQRKRDRKKVVVDTSVLMSATIVDGAYRKLIRKLISMDFELCIPQDVIDEYYEVIKREKFRKYEPLFTQILDELKKSSIILPLATSKKYTLENSEDEAIINCCVQNGIDYLITADKKSTGTFNGLEVIFAVDFYSKYLSN